jgi:hypothetical protein
MPHIIPVTFRQGLEAGMVAERVPDGIDIKQRDPEEGGGMG